MNELLNDVVTGWRELDIEDQAYFIKALASIPGMYVGYKFYRKLGAPKWAAWGLTTIGQNVAIAPDRFAYEQRKRARTGKR